MVLICMIRASKPLQLTSGKFVVLSLYTFTDVRISPIALRTTHIFPTDLTNFLLWSLTFRYWKLQWDTCPYYERCYDGYEWSNTREQVLLFVLFAWNKVDCKVYVETPRYVFDRNFLYVVTRKLVRLWGSFRWRSSFFRRDRKNVERNASYKEKLYTFAVKKVSFLRIFSFFLSLLLRVNYSIGSFVTSNERILRPNSEVTRKG